MGVTSSKLFVSVPGLVELFVVALETHERPKT